MIDITAPKHEVEISISTSGLDGLHVIWINVDGRCALRACRVVPEIIKLDDKRSLQELSE
jgi:hypothetical protein